MALCAGAGQFQIALENGAGLGDAFKSGLFAAASAGIADGIGTLAQKGAISIFEQAVLHGVSQGGLSVAQGGKFGSAFLSGSFASLAGSALPKNIDIVSGTAVSAIVGGTASVIGGGKFANGAVTGAFVYAFNEAAGEWARNERRGISTETSVNGRTGAHRYKITGIICRQSTPGCDQILADRVYTDVNANDVPFTSNDLGNGQRNLIPWLPRPLGNQPIEHFENVGLRTSLNVALDGHNFFQVQ